jgi:hypothetical protein
MWQAVNTWRKSLVSTEMYCEASPEPSIQYRLFVGTHFPSHAGSLAPPQDPESLYLTFRIPLGSVALPVEIEDGVTSGGSIR